MAIGGVTASYSSLLAVVLDFPQIDGADRVARLWTIDIKGGSRVGKVSVRDFLEWERQTQAFEALAGFESQTQGRLKGTHDSLLVAIQPATEAFFRVLAALPVLGTAFPRDAAAFGERIAVLSHRVWQRGFGGDRAVVGRVVTLNGEPHTVVGVMPDGFRFPTPGDTVFAPLPLPERDGPRAERRSSRSGGSVPASAGRARGPRWRPSRRA